MSTETLSTLDIVNPGTGESVASVPSATPEDVDHAVRTAHAAQRAWGRLGYAERGQHLHQIARAFEAHSDSRVLCSGLNTSANRFASTSSSNAAYTVVPSTLKA